MKRDYGFTLVELMVTLVIAAILLTAGVPSFTTLIKNNRLTTSTNELVGALTLARSEAVKRGLRVTVCKSADQASCDTSGTGWQQGWIVFTDENNSGTYNPTGTPAGAWPLARPADHQRQWQRRRLYLLCRIGSESAGRR